MSWQYAPSRTLAGQLQRGLGRGAHRASVDPDARELIYACIRRDHRWFWQLDEREVYLARLVRDLDLPVDPLVDRLSEAQSDDNEFNLTTEVLLTLALSGSAAARDGLLSYVRSGRAGWVDVLQDIAGRWPVDWWDDLLPLVPPPSAGRHKPARPYAEADTDELIALLVRTEAPSEVLRELRRRPPEPALLDLVDGLPTSGQLAAAVVHLGELAVPAARRWIADGGHPLIWQAFLLLADHGDESDLPAVLAGFDWLDDRPDDLCGYDRLAEGLARIGGTVAIGAVPRLIRLWFSPHSAERAAYLRAVLALDPETAGALLREGLWDCESKVRLIAAQHVTMTGAVGERLRYLSDDPIEEPEVRAAASTRLGRSSIVDGR